LYLPLVVALLALLGVAFGWNTFRSIGRVDLADALQPVAGDATNILIVGSDSRDGVGEETPNAAAMGSEGVAGERSDTIIVLRLQGGRASMLSIPRDLWVTNVATGREGRVNAAYNDGPANLVRTVTTNLGIPVNRYLEVDFVSFAGMVDALGGVDIDFPHTAFDRNSGLLVGEGTQRLDGTQALAYVRSRHYTEVIDGREVVDPTGDLGRQQRQQTFIRTVLGAAGGARNPLTLARLGRAGASGARIDDQWGFFDAFGVARRLAGADPATFVLPTVGARRGSAAVLLLVEDQAQPVLAEFGAGG
jgi:LCP family protein required for cell wall assembly